ncbi:clathrin [Striga asiatica]|uniref:Clathrin n=1 Tax=Striga asiatica TaxID=4170 RepID=A0A5A7QCH1_STRAF|nr:clathrin [Striga asiatica]
MKFINFTRRQENIFFPPSSETNFPTRMSCLNLLIVLILVILFLVHLILCNILFLLILFPSPPEASNRAGDWRRGFGLLHDFHNLLHSLEGKRGIFLSAWGRASVQKSILQFQVTMAYLLHIKRLSGKYYYKEQDLQFKNLCKFKLFIFRPTCVLDFSYHGMAVADARNELLEEVP